jgi:hypothetical protein
VGVREVKVNELIKEVEAIVEKAPQNVLENFRGDDVVVCMNSHSSAKHKLSLYSISPITIWVSR